MSRVPLILALILLAGPLAPVASANAPPVAHASASTLDAVLFEPVTFTDDSIDPDGTIVRSVWTDTDGRDHAANPWTHAFAFAGVHTVTLVTTDDSGASASTEIQVLVRAPTMRGRAFALGAGDARVADSGEVASEQQGDTRQSVGAVRQGGLHAEGLDGDVWIVGQHTVATATIESVRIPHPLGYFLLTGVQAQAIVGCDFPTMRSATFSQFRLNDAPLVPPGQVAPNTRVELPGGMVVLLNVQEPGAAPDTLRVTAARILAPGAPAIDVAHAEAGASHCPYSQ